MKITSHILILTLAGATTSSAQVKNYDSRGGHKLISEENILTITRVPQNIRKTSIKGPDPDPFAPGGAAAPVAAALIATIPPLINTAIKGVQTISKNSIAKYTGQYKMFASEDDFYQNVNTANLPKLTVRRDLILATGAKPIAVQFDLEPELSTDLTAFRYKLNPTVTYKYSVAKTKGQFDYVDVQVNLVFKTLAIIDNKYEVKELRGTSLTFPINVGCDGCHVGTNHYSGWLPLLPFPQLQFEYAVRNTSTGKETITTTTKHGKLTETDKVMDKATETKYNVKEIEEIKSNSGVYEFEVTVVETNRYKVKAEQKSQMIEATGESANEVVKTLVDKLSEKEEEVKSE